MSATSRKPVARRHVRRSQARSMNVLHVTKSGSAGSNSPAKRKSPHAVVTVHAKPTESVVASVVTVQVHPKPSADREAQATERVLDTRSVAAMGRASSSSSKRMKSASAQTTNVRNTLAVFGPREGPFTVHECPSCGPVSRGICATCFQSFDDCHAVSNRTHQFLPSWTFDVDKRNNQCACRSGGGRQRCAAVLERLPDILAALKRELQVAATPKPTNETATAHTMHPLPKIADLASLGSGLQITWPMYHFMAALTQRTRALPAQLTLADASVVSRIDAVEEVLRLLLTQLTLGTFRQRRITVTCAQLSDRFPQLAKHFIPCVRKDFMACVETDDDATSSSLMRCEASSKRGSARRPTSAAAASRSSTVASSTNALVVALRGQIIHNSCRSHNAREAVNGRGCTVHVEVDREVEANVNDFTGFDGYVSVDSAEAADSLLPDEDAHFSGFRTPATCNTPSRATGCFRTSMPVRREPLTDTKLSHGEARSTGIVRFACDGEDAEGANHAAVASVTAIASVTAVASVTVEARIHNDAAAAAEVGDDTEDFAGRFARFIRDRADHHRVGSSVPQTPLTLPSFTPATTPRYAGLASVPDAAASDGPQQRRKCDCATLAASSTAACTTANAGKQRCGFCTEVMLDPSFLEVCEANPSMKIVPVVESGSTIPLTFVPSRAVVLAAATERDAAAKLETARVHDLAFRMTLANHSLECMAQLVGDALRAERAKTLK